MEPSIVVKGNLKVMNESKRQRNMCRQVQVQLYDLCHDIVGSIILVVVVWGSRASNLDNSIEELQ